MRYTKQQVRQIRIEITQALNEIAQKYDSGVRVGRISFGEDLQTSITFSHLSENEHGKYIYSKEAREFLDRAEGFGLTQNVLNEKCNYLGNTYVVTGYNTRAKKYPINMTQNGKPMKCSVEYMKSFVRAQRPELFL